MKRICGIGFYYGGSFTNENTKSSVTFNIGKSQYIVKMYGVSIGRTFFGFTIIGNPI